jgi:hypothetical protein
MSASDVARAYFEHQTEGDMDATLHQFGQDARFIGPMGELPFPDA